MEARWPSQPATEVTEIKYAYHDATELLVRLSNLLENGAFHSAAKDGATALGLAGWLLSGLNESIRISEGVKLVEACAVLVEEDISSRAKTDGACALRIGDQLVNALFRGPGVVGRTFIQIRDDLICWSDYVEMNVFPHGNSGPEALRLATDLLRLTMRLM
jgi:hypothetical protein